MKFVLRSGLNAGASLVVSLFTLYMLSVLTSIIIDTDIYDSVFEVIAQFVILAFQFSPFLEFAMLYLINLLVNKIGFLRLSTLKSLWSITVGALMLGLYYAYREWLSGDISGPHILDIIFDSIINMYFVVKCSGIFILSLIANPILAKRNQEKGREEIKSS